MQEKKHKSFKLSEYQWSCVCFGYTQERGYFAYLIKQITEHHTTSTTTVQLHIQDEIMKWIWKVGLLHFCTVLQSKTQRDKSERKDSLKCVL